MDKRKIISLSTLGIFITIIFLEPLWLETIFQEEREKKPALEGWDFSFILEGNFTCTTSEPNFFSNFSFITRVNETTYDIYTSVKWYWNEVLQISVTNVNISSNNFRIYNIRTNPELSCYILPDKTPILQLWFLATKIGGIA